MEKSLNFYRLLLQKEPLYCNDDRWIAFDCGNQIALYNKKYDEKLLKNLVIYILIKHILMISLKKILLKRIILSYLILK